MRALTPKRILTNPFCYVHKNASLCCVNFPIIVLSELRSFSRNIRSNQKFRLSSFTVKDREYFLNTLLKDSEALNEVVG